MTNKELQQLLAAYPDDMPVKWLNKTGNFSGDIVDFDEDHFMRSSETVYINDDAPEDEWDCEDGKVELGDGQQFLLFNPIVV